MKLYDWYFRTQKDRGVDLSDGFERVKKFMTQYKKALKGEIEC